MRTSAPRTGAIEHARVQAAADIMQAFAARTGLQHAGTQQRYLWTDAFAVDNCLALEAAGPGAGWGELAERLVDVVHATLAHERRDAASGAQVRWLSGPLGAADEAHPTRAGLRIGKPLPERARDAAPDPRLEWERDGQYFHYLTRWMLALDRLARAHGEPRYHGWACELALVAHAAFVQRAPEGTQRMVWKMRTDLSAPLVSSMGHHDPLDGYATVRALSCTASELGTEAPPELDRIAADYLQMLQGRDPATDDPLGLGGLLLAAAELARVGADEALLARLLEAAMRGLGTFTSQFDPDAPPSRRLGFRELGLALGLAAVDNAADACTAHGCGTQAADLRRYLPLGSAIEGFWLRPQNQAAHSWQSHLDINEVMLAARLLAANG